MLAPLLRNRGIQLIGGGWSFFLAENLVLSHNRSWIIESIGDDNYHRLYNTLSTCACTSIAFGYFRFGRNQGPRFWSPTGLAPRASAFLLQSLGLAGFSQMLPRLQVPIITEGTSFEGSSRGASSRQDSSLRVRCPMDFTPSDVPQDGIYGVKRVTRHPSFWSLGFLGLGSALATPFATEALMFSMPTIFALVGGAHQDYRYRRNLGGELSPEVDAVTSNVPFVALSTGKQSWVALGEELKWTNVALALFTSALLALRRQTLMPR